MLKSTSAKLYISAAVTGIILIILKAANLHFTSDLVFVFLLDIAIVLALSGLLRSVLFSDDSLLSGILLGFFILIALGLNFVLLLAGKSMEEEYYKNRKEPVTYFSHSDGSRTLVSADFYFFGILYHENSSEKVMMESPTRSYEIKDEYTLPAGLGDSAYINVWKGENTILELQNEIAYPLIPKKN